MSNKIKILLGIILVEIMAIAFSISIQSKQTSLNDNSLQQFAILDSTGVHRFIFGKNTLERNEVGTWIVNQKYTADAPLIRQLFQVLAKIEIKKPVSDNMKKEIAEQFKTQGIDIQILKEGKTVQSFKMLDIERECIVQKPDGEAFVIYVPGYNISLSEVFKLSEGDWRAKTVISSSFFGVKKIALTYTEKPQESFVIERDSTFFKVQGISKLDSNMVGNYVDAYKNIRVFSFLDKPAMKDSLLKTQPYCIIEVEDIDKSKNNSIKVFTDKKQLFGILGKTEELVELEPRYFTRFFVRKKDFAK
ncbi:hypothetical protein [Thermoflexibacter ruber]|uniref:DUF4340 domain-containing protein n=1 Tax=Thermoflexibacter ruber TaxID=1003 RepID=A0A1I2C361_9BACT|nr:hypothetical protein [Thermoflexibacter ruber]SFE62618.1 hypothetical protein SAMN04488541_100455 [Thermoflexibacter ruber]